MSLQITTNLTFNNQNKETKATQIEVNSVVKQCFEKPSETTADSGKQLVQTQIPQHTLMHSLKMKKGF